METTSAKRNFVFISYNHKDVKWAQWLQKKLEWYRLPTEIHNEFSDSRYIRPVFRDRDTLTSGVLNDELRNHLEASQFLVVLCSPNSAKSEWVSDEIKAFIEMGRLDKIVPFIVDGNPQDYSHADISQPLMGECFPRALREWNTNHPDKNLLGIAVTDDGKTDRQKAFIRLVAHLLGVEFDTLWQRHKRYIRRMIAMLSVLAVVALALVYWFMIPVKVSVTIKDDKSQLPEMEHGILNVNGSEYHQHRGTARIQQTEENPDEFPRRQVLYRRERDAAGECGHHTAHHAATAPRQHVCRLRRSSVRRGIRQLRHTPLGGREGDGGEI